MDSDCVEYFKHTFACAPSMVFDGGCNEIFTVENKLKLFRHPKIEDDLRRSLPVLCVTKSLASLTFIMVSLSIGSVLPFVK